VGVALPTNILPANDEIGRLEALSRYEVLNTDPEAAYDRITRIARTVFDAPIGLISLVDSERQFFKSKVGLELNQTPREQSFCAHGILQDEALVVPDALADGRFANNPLVTGYPNIRFYAGAQLKTKDGFRLGSLCVIDSVARSYPSADQMAVLVDLADQVVELLEARRNQRELERVRRTQLADRKRWSRMEQTAALALDAGKMGFWEYDELMGQGHWSERMFQFHSMASSLMSAPSIEEWSKLVHPEDRMDFAASLKRIRRSADTFSFKYRVKDADGSERCITTAGDHYFAEDGSLLGSLGVCWDSTEADRRERALQESEELFRILSSASPVGIVRTDRDGNSIYANPKLAEIWQLPIEQFTGRNWVSRIHPDDVDALLQDWEAATRKGRPFEMEFRLLMPNGTIRWMHGRSALVLDRYGRQSGSVGTIDDITDRKKALHDLHEAKHVAELASQSKDIFLTNISHELRTPLNGVLGMIELLLDTELDPDQRQMAEIVRDSGTSLLNVVNDILDLSRIQACKLTLESIPFDWDSMLRQVFTGLQPDADRKGLQLTLEQPQGALGKFVGDASRIQQILLVYLTNALKFTSMGRVTVSVASERLSQSAVELLVMVRDTGPGIPLAHQNKLFKPFSQVDESITRKHGGTGLGLAIAKRLAELMGGNVGVVSSAGNGSTFWLRLTLSTAVRSAEAQKRKIHPGSRRVLVVEDNFESQMVAMNMLWKLGWQADLVSDGALALEIVRQDDYAMVFMDCQMSRMDGYETTEEIRKWERAGQRDEVPIVALTAHAMEGDRERCLNVGMNDYLSKPVSLEELRKVLDQWAGNSEINVPGAMLA
jgi:PAS domain S-box-containing protein